MAPSELALRRARRAYEHARRAAAARGLAIAAAAVLAAVALHRMTGAAWVAAAGLAAILAAAGWRGGAARRGALAGALAGVPTLIVPTLVMGVSPAGHCASCGGTVMTVCAVACFATSALVGALVGRRALADAAPRRFAVTAIAAAALTGLLGCGTIGLGGAVGVVAGVVAGGITGWLFAGSTAHA
jgi:hypothetical protein